MPPVSARAPSSAAILKYRCTVSNWSWVISGPTSRPGRSARVAVTTASTKRSCTCRWTSRRVPDEQTWPALVA